jgi:hypothetical protein
LGWFEFVNEHCPVDGDAVVVAFEAFTFLFLDEGIWIRHTAGLSAILAFLREQTGHSPTREQVTALKDILCAERVSESGLEDWFYGVFP